VRSKRNSFILNSYYLILNTIKMPSQEFIARMKQRLQEEKEKFEAELSGLQAHTEVGDQEDENASEFQNDEVANDIIVQLKSEVTKIDAALKRIEDGTYGKSTVSGEEISEARLEVLPWAETAADEEQEGNQFVA
jgi:DnaK suppressor protein